MAAEQPVEANLEGSSLHDWRQSLADGNAAAALSSYLSAGSRDPEIVAALTTLSDTQALLRAKRWSRAESLLSGADEQPALLDWQQLVAELETLKKSDELLDRRRPEEALELLATVTAPVLRAETLAQRGTAHIFLAEEAQAEVAFAEALERDPKHYRAMTNLGNLALERGDVDEAIGAYEQALKIDEDFANAHHNLGVAYRRKGQLNKSVRSIRRAQRSMRRHDKEEARGQMAKLTKTGGGKLLRWLLYGAIALALFFFLRSQGVI